MRRFHWVLSLALSGCALHAAGPSVTASTAPETIASTPAAEPAPAPARVAAEPVKPSVAAPVEADVEAEAVAAESESSGEAVDEEAADDSDEGGEDEPVAEEVESPESSNANGPQYTADLSDEELAAKWKSSPESLGSISFGFVGEGRLMNAEHFPNGEGWRVVSPEKAWATHETIQYVLAAIARVREQFPNAPPLRVNQISYRDGGFCRPHKSHQNGRDVDLGFYYPTPDPIIVREREKVIDVAANWALVKAVITTGDVQFILVDRRVQKVLYDYALNNGEDKTWLDSLFHGGPGLRPMLMHARGHRDHFHVRYFNPRAQELGRRVAPLLAQRPEQNIAMHRVRKGDTLSGIAVRYNSTVTLLKKANRMRSSFLRIAQVLRVPLRGPCTHCPVPPPIVVPERRLPPTIAQTETPVAQVPVAEKSVLAPPLSGETSTDPTPDETRVAAAPASATVVPAAAVTGAAVTGAAVTGAASKPVDEPTPTPAGTTTGAADSQMR